MGIIGLIRRMKINKRGNTTKRRVRLFLNLSKFCAICFLSANSADYANLFPQPTFTSPASFVGKEKVLANGSNEENVFSPFDPYDSPQINRNDSCRCRVHRQPDSLLSSDDVRIPYPGMCTKAVIRRSPFRSHPRREQGPCCTGSSPASSCPCWRTRRRGRVSAWSPCA